VEKGIAVRGVLICIRFGTLIGAARLNASLVRVSLSTIFPCEETVKTSKNLEVGKTTILVADIWAPSFIRSLEEVQKYILFYES
jgi:hypothetical protein